MYAAHDTPCTTLSMRQEKPSNFRSESGAGDIT